MKKIYLLLPVFAGLLLIASCSKDNGPDHFTYKGIDYPIDSVTLIEMVFDKGTVDEQSIFQFAFVSINGQDTTSLLLGLLDNNSNELNGNYPALIQNEETATRGIVPFGIIIMSGVFFQDDTYQMTGGEGSLDVKNNNGIYSVKFNKISAGVYTDLLDSNHDGNVGYTEVSTVGGSFNGPIERTLINVSKSNAGTLPLLKAMRARVK